MSFGPGLFEPPGGEWKRLSPRYIPVKRIGSLIGNTVLFGGMAALAWALLREMWVVFAVLAAGASVLAWRLWRDGRWVRSWGYAQRDGDLCITHGLMWKNLPIIPSGRMQMVKVSSGPIERAFGLASVELITASPETAATISGLAEPDAVALRDELIELSDAEGSGL